jgi:hypothetical protein
MLGCFCFLAALECRTLVVDSTMKIHTTEEAIDHHVLHTPHMLENPVVNGDQEGQDIILDAMIDERDVARVLPQAVQPMGRASRSKSARRGGRLGM